MLSAAHFFMLDELQFYCESLAAGSITKDNVITVYQKAKVSVFDFKFVCVFLSLLVKFILPSYYFLEARSYYQEINQ